MIELKLFIKNLTQNYPDYRLIICGDFNLNFLDKRKPIIQEFKNFLNAHGLLQKVKSYTYPSFISESTQKSLLDLIIVNNEENVSVVNTNQSISKTCDHLLIDFRIDFITETESNLNIFFTDYSNEVNLSEFRLRLKNFNWDQIFDQNLDINEIYDKMIDVLVDIKNKCFIPKKVKKKPIFDKNIKRLIKLKRKSFKTFYETNDKFYYIYGKPLFDRIKQKLEEKHLKEYQKIIQKSDNFKSLYKEVKNKNKANDSLVFKALNNEVIDDNKEICNHFSENFFSKYTALQLPDYSKDTNNTKFLNNFLITKTDILRELMQMKANKSCIGSEIPTVLLKSCSDIFCEIFYKFFNLMLCFNLIPQKLKELIVLPIYKTGKPINSFDSYRPITIEKNILKLFCKLIFNNISSFVNKTNVIPHNQYGFRPNLSVYNQLIDILYFITNSFNDKNVLCVDIIFLDMSNAFDRLSFKSILEAYHEIIFTSVSSKLKLFLAPNTI